jgi:protein-S-isoprenylcysteine O-methyltransferase Ste14
MHIKSEYKPHIFMAIAIISAVYLFFSGPLFIQNLPILLTQVFGLLLIAWAGLAIQLNKPHRGTTNLPQGYFLVTKGPYEIIRHPIYAGVMLLMSGYVQGEPSMLRYLVFVAFFVALLLKLLNEESVLEKEVKDYEDYRKKTHKLIPYLY